jgi:TldD protein
MIEQLLNENYLNQDKIEGLLSDLFVKGTDYADLYFQHSIAESWFLEEGIVKSGTYNISHGVGVRAVKAEQTGFAYSDDLNIDAIHGDWPKCRYQQCCIFHWQLVRQFSP